MLGPLLLFMCLTTHVFADKLNVAYQWKTVEFEFPSEDLKQEALLSKKYIPENQLPLGVEVYGNRLFVTLPRWKYGVAASLAYIDRTQGNRLTIIHWQIMIFNI